MKSNSQMFSLPPNLYSQWRREHLALPALRETEADALPDELLLQQIWWHQRLRRDALRTLDGRPVVVLHPGFPNREAGPDFRAAVVRIGSEPPVSGDIEVDLHPVCWQQHQHVLNPAYAQVRLHVVWEPDASPPTALPTLALHQVLDAPLIELQEWLGGEVSPAPPASQLGQCAAALGTLPAARLAELLGQAAKVRLESKARQLEARAQQAGWDQALWEGLFAALGYKHNVWPMRRLAELLPQVRPLPTRETVPPIALQARLLGLAGLLPSELTRARPTTDQYLRQLWDHWWREREALQESVLPPSAWCFAGLRPANHPQRRLALAAYWLADPAWLERLTHWFSEAVPLPTLAGSLLTRLQVELDEFWSWHWTLRSARMFQPRPLLGAPRVTDLAVNAILPWFWVRARAGRDAALAPEAERRYFGWPAAQDNAVLRLARQRLFGQSRPALPRTAALQQGLLQIVRDFCDHSNALCANCRFPRLVHSLQAASPASHPSLAETVADATGRPRPPHRASGPEPEAANVGIPPVQCAKPLGQLPPLVLASASPRRAALLRQLGLDFTTAPAETPELHHRQLTARELSLHNAARKAAAVAARFPDALILAADTLVYLGATLFGKPRTLEEAEAMLCQLQGRTHQVVTGVCLLHRATGRTRRFAEITHVVFRPLTLEEVRDYLARVHPLDKAGAYGLQEHGDRIVARIHGSYSNVVGLPLERLAQELSAWPLGGKG